MKRVVLFCSAFLLLAACTGGASTHISFIGMGTGTLTTNLDDIHFQTRFPVDEHNLLGVVSFDHPMNGATVHATWFSPDERHMPLGRSPVILGSGATVARFSLQSKGNWQPAPYELRIDVYEPGESGVLVASGSTAFYIGMKEEDIQAYQQDFQAWQAADAEQRATWEAEHKREEAVIDSVKPLVREQELTLVTRYDVNSDGSLEYLIVSKQEGPTGGVPGVIATVQTNIFALVDGSGTTFLALQPDRGRRVLKAGDHVLYQAFPTGPVTLTMLTSGTVSVGWRKDKTFCTLEARFTNGAYTAAEPVCR